MRASRFTFFGGKGGVGKTTCAAAAAVRAANEGARVLVVSMDPAHSLADALELAGPTGVAGGPRGLGRGRPVAITDRLYAAELDADRALERWLHDRREAIRTIAERGTYLDDEDIDRFMALSLPGVDELVGLVELLRLARLTRVTRPPIGKGSRAEPFDHVVVDTAPTGHTLRLVTMPEALARLAAILDDMHAKHRFLASSLGRAWRGDFADDVIAAIEEEAKAIRALLVAPETSFTWVTLAEEMPVLEAERGIAALERLAIRVDTVVVNRLRGPDAEAYEPRWRGAIAERFATRRLLAIPALDEEPRGVARLGALAMRVRRLEEPATKGSSRARTSVVGGGEASRTPAIGAPTKASATRGDRANGSWPSRLGIPATARLVLVGGKGGVGKTTIAATTALALAAARPKARVLVLSTDPAHSLGDVLGIALGDDARIVPGTSLSARELDAEAAFDRERTRYRAAIDEVFAGIFGGRMDIAFDRAVLEDLLEMAPPGIDELLALVTILDAVVPSGGGAEARRVRAGTGLETPYDVVVVDTAPTGHTLRLLELPPKALAWVHALMAVLLKYRSVVGLGDLASDITALAKRIRALIALLADPEATAFVAVARAAKLPAIETARLTTALARLHVPLASIVVNAVPSRPSRPSRGGAEEHASLAALERLAKKHRCGFTTMPVLLPPPCGARALAAFAETPG